MALFLPITSIENRSYTMKKLALGFSILLCLVTAICLIGCQSTSRNNPEGVVSTFFDSVQTGDTKKAISFFADRKYKSTSSDSNEAYFRI
jgi:hypothetical protein